MQFLVIILHKASSVIPYRAWEPQKAFYLTDFLVSETSDKWHMDDTHDDKKNAWVFLQFIWQPQIKSQIYKAPERHNPSDHL